jgi:hypothetical protein
MFKANPTFCKGFNFVQISNLPFDQRMAFDEWIPDSSVQRLIINDISLPDCVAYQEYSYWFEFLFQKNGGILEVSF